MITKDQVTLKREDEDYYWRYKLALHLETTLRAVKHSNVTADFIKEELLDALNYELYGAIRKAFMDYHIEVFNIIPPSVYMYQEIKLKKLADEMFKLLPR